MFIVSMFLKTAIKALIVVEISDYELLLLFITVIIIILTYIEFINDPHLSRETIKLVPCKT